MVQVRTRLKIIDNSGAREAMCIRILGGAHVGYVGNTIVVSVKRVLPNRRIKKGEVHRAILTTTVRKRRRRDGSYVQFSENSAILVDLKGALLGTRILSPVSSELSSFLNGPHKKILALAPAVL